MFRLEKVAMKINFVFNVWYQLYADVKLREPNGNGNFETAAKIMISFFQILYHQKYFIHAKQHYLTFRRFVKEIQRHKNFGGNIVRS